MSFFSDVTFLQYHMVYLNNEYSLCDLFDKISVSPAFLFPERSISVNLENITFGPNERVVSIPSKEHLKPRLIYYSLLHYIFEMDTELDGTNIYEKLLSFIFKHDLSLQTQSISIGDEEAKTYFIQFCYSLYRERCKSKIVVEQLSAIPQMDILFRHLIEAVAGVEESKFKSHGQEVQDNIRKELGFSVQFINSTMILFQNEYIVELRQFEDNTEFSIRKTTEDDVKIIIDGTGLNQTAFFCHQNQSEVPEGLCSSKEILENENKVETTKSIGFQQALSKDVGSNNSHPNEDDIVMGMRSFGSVPVSKQHLKASKQNSTKVFDEFDKLINSSKYFKEQANLIVTKNQNTIQNQPLKNEELFPTVRNIKSVSWTHKNPSENVHFSKFTNRSKRTDHKYASTMIFDKAYVFETKKLVLGEKANCLKSERLRQESHPIRQEKRVPSFVMTREKIKKEKGRQTVESVSFSERNKENVNHSTKQSKITFSYRQT